MSERSPRLRTFLLALGALAVACGNPKGPPRGAARDASVTTPDAGPTSSARLESSRGAVTLTRAGHASKAQGGTPLFTGDTLDTGADGAAVLRFPDGRELELGPEGHFVLGQDASGVVLQVDQGLVLSRVAARPALGAPEGDADVSLSILTPFGLTRVGNAQARVDVSKDSASVSVSLGELTLVRANGETVKLTTGEPWVVSRSGATREITLAPIFVSIDATEGRVEVQKEGKGRFVGAKAGQALAAGDAVRVVEGKLSLKAGDSDARFVLQRGTEVVVGVASSGSGSEAFDLPLKKGTLTVTAPSGKAQRLQLAPGVVLQGDSAARYSVTRTGEGFDLQTLTGFVTVLREGEGPQKVGGGQWATLGKAPVAVRDGLRQAVVLPSRAGLWVAHPALPLLSLSWEAEAQGAPGPFRVTVANTEGFEAPLLDGDVATPFVSLRPPPRGALFWKVMKGGHELARGSARFAPEPPSAELSRVRNEVPEGPEKTTIFFQDKPPSVSFTWKADPALAATSYKVSVYREGQLAAPLVERTVPASPLQLPESVLGEGRYAWSVTPLSAKGAPLKGGRMSTLELAYDNAVARLVIHSPRNGDPASRAVPVTGIAPVGARLFVNGQAVPLDAKARFSTTLAPIGQGRFVFRLVQGLTESYTVRVVR